MFFCLQHKCAPWIWFLGATLILSKKLFNIPSMERALKKFTLLHFGHFRWFWNHEPPNARPPTAFVHHTGPTCLSPVIPSVVVWPLYWLLCGGSLGCFSVCRVAYGEFVEQEVHYNPPRFLLIFPDQEEGHGRAQCMSKINVPYV